MSHVQKINLYWKHLFAHDFIKDFSVLLSSSVLKQAIGFITLPLLARLYSPDAFGLLELFLAIGALVATVACFRFELTIGLSHDKESAANILALCALLITFVFFLTLICVGGAVFIFHQDPIFFILPVYISAFAFSQALTYYQLKFEDYQSVAKFRTYKVLFVQGSCFLGIFLNSTHGLIIGHVVGEGLATLILLQMSLKYFSIQDISLRGMRKNLHQHHKLASTMVISHFIGSAALRIPVFFIPLISSVEALGYYSICQRILGTPGIIAENIGTIYRQKAIEEKRVSGSFNHCFRLYFLKTFIGSIPIFTFIFLFPSFILSIVMGTYPGEILDYFQILSLGALFSFISTPLDKGAIIENEKMYIFGWQFLRLFISFFISAAFYYFLKDVGWYIFSLVFLSSSLYTFDLVIEYKLSLGRKNHKVKVI